ncbi:MAG: TIGR00266 family protein [Candidatus Parvarchaeota archaeon]|nr:TIGR00266 family protein [Candidatus Parvarchaeota archaeon]MCL5107157.1 TIGR00266 family protein [Candidatus Parvarchaeota archaeon]
MVNYTIVGNEVQYVQAEINSGESVLCEAGHLIFKSPDATVETKTGGLKGAFSHLLAGSDVFLLKLNGPGVIGFSGFLPGRILEISLNETGILAEFNSFLCMDSSITYSTKFAGIWKGLLGGEGLFLEKFSGNGKIFLHGHGQVIEISLGEGESIDAEAGHVLAFEANMQYSINRIGGVKTMILGGLEGEGLFFARITGPGKVWLHSISLAQLAAKMGGGNTGDRNAALMGGLAGIALKAAKK